MTIFLRHVINRSRISHYFISFCVSNSFLTWVLILKVVGHTHEAVDRHFALELLNLRMRIKGVEILCAAPITPPIEVVQEAAAAENEDDLPELEEIKK